MKKAFVLIVALLIPSLAFADAASQLMPLCGVQGSCASQIVSTVNNPPGPVVVQSGDLILKGSGGIYLQEATAGSKCMGQLTCNGASDVVTATTCAKTAARIFLTRASLDADTTGDFYVKAISNGVSFTVACEANDTAVLNWIIFNESP